MFPSKKLLVLLTAAATAKVGAGQESCTGDLVWHSNRWCVQPTCLDPIPDNSIVCPAVSGCACPEGTILYVANGESCVPSNLCPNNPCSGNMIVRECQTSGYGKSCDKPELEHGFGVCRWECYCPGDQIQKFTGSYDCVDPDQCPNHGGGAGGDPHFKTFGQEWFDFHGECDLVLVSAPNFSKGIGLNIHIRTTRRYDYSYIFSAAIQVGGDDGGTVLQVSSYGEYMLDGVSNAEMPAVLSDLYPVVYTTSGDTIKQHVFDVQLSRGQHVIIKSFKDLVSVKLEYITAEDFAGSVGLMGDFETGSKLARDGTTALKDNINAFGQEWQVLESEPKLFQTNRHPQHPDGKCLLPDPASNNARRRRRLGETVARDSAEQACAHWDETEQEHCIYDVMASGDMDLANLAGVF